MAEATAETPLRFDTAFLRQIGAQHRGALTFAHAMVFVMTLAELPLPLLFPLIVDEVVLGQPGPLVALLHRVLPAAWHGPLAYVAAVLVVTIALRCVALLCGVLQAQRFAAVAQDVLFQMRRALLHRLGRITLAEYETRGSGGVAAHFVTDMATINTFVSSTLSRFLVSILTLLGVAAVLLWVHWQLALFILFLNPVVVYFTTTLGKRVRALKQRENSAIEVFQEALTETLDAIHQLRASNREKHYLSHLVDRARGVREHSTSFAWKQQAASRASYLVFLVGFDLFRAVAILAVLFSGLTVGRMLAVFSYLWTMMTPVQTLLNLQYSYFAAKAALARIQRFLSLREEVSFPELEDPFAGRRGASIRVSGLRFAYGGRREVLRGVDLDIAAGETVALVGASGGGKSTFVHALVGLYERSAGTLEYGGVPVERIGWRRVRSRVATVLQHPALLNDTVRANLTLGLRRPDDQLWEALGTVQLAQDVRRLPKGLDAVLGRHGVRFSGGQRQRLAIARAVLAEPCVVVLDEATSAVDMETEERLHDALAEFLHGRTTLIVAHRLSALRLADRVLVFEAGRIVEQGSHEALMSHDGLYAQLYGKGRRGRDVEVGPGRRFSKGAAR